MKSNSNKKQTNLPWWVELLFVQIGLPDQWLSKLLKTRKETYKFLDVNKKYLIYSSMIIAAIFYIYPIVRYTSSSASCIDKTTKYLKSKKINNAKDAFDINSLAVGYCHGGQLPQ